MAEGIVAWVGPAVTSVSVLFAALTYKKAQLDKVSRQASGVHAWIKGGLVPILRGVNESVRGIRVNLTMPTGNVVSTTLVQFDADGPVSIHILNSSDHPVYDCRVDIRWLGYFVRRIEGFSEPISVVPGEGLGLSLMYSDKMQQRVLWSHSWMPWEGELGQWERFFSRDGAKVPPSPLPPGGGARKFSLESELGFSSNVAHFENEDEDDFLVAIVATIESIRFVDHSGKVWTRYPDGELVLSKKVNLLRRKIFGK